jgi:hypothetical protein
MIARYFWALDPGGASGTPCIYTGRTAVSGSASYAQETENITGAAGAVVTLQVTAYTTGGNTMGQLFINGSAVFLNTSFTVTLDGSGHGSYTIIVQGDPSQTGTAVFARVTIQSVSVGQLGNPLFIQVSKAF